jgi:hypothetical protein
MNLAIFPYHDGERDRFGDPIAIYRKLVQSLGGDLQGWLDRRWADNEQAAAMAWDKVLDAVRGAFEMKPFAPDGSGATDQHCDDTIHAYLEWLEKKKLNTGPTPT